MQTLNIFTTGSLQDHTRTVLEKEIDNNGCHEINGHGIVLFPRLEPPAQA